MQAKYPALHTIANLFRIVAWITLIWTAVAVIIGVIATLVSGQYLGVGFLGFIGELLGAVFGSFLVLVFYGSIGVALAVLEFAAAEGIQVLLDIEENTRSG